MKKLQILPVIEPHPHTALCNQFKSLHPEVHPNTHYKYTSRQSLQHSWLPVEVTHLLLQSGTLRCL